MKNKQTVILARRMMCENSKFKIFFDHIQWDNDEVVPDYIVVAPKIQTENHVTGVSILPVAEDRIGLIKVFRHAVGDFFWEVPRGFIDPGESAETAAVRELREETWLKCREKDLLTLGFITPEAGVLAARLQLFVALNCVQDDSYIANEIGHQEFRFFESRQVASMIEQSEIQDPSTIVIYFKYILRNQKF